MFASWVGFACGSNRPSGGSGYRRARCRPNRRRPRRGSVGFVVRRVEHEVRCRPPPFGTGAASHPLVRSHRTPQARGGRPAGDSSVQPFPGGTRAFASAETGPPVSAGRSQPGPGRAGTPFRSVDGATPGRGGGRRDSAFRPSSWPGVRGIAASPSCGAASRPAGGLTVGDLLDRWLEAMRPTWARGTHASHDQHVRNHLRRLVGGLRLAKFLATHVQHLTATMEGEGAPASMRRHVAVTLRAALQYAVAAGLAVENVAKRVPLPMKPKHRSEGITLEEVAAFLAAAASGRLYAIYVLAVDSGLRQGELLALTWKDIDFARNRVLAVKPPKTASAVRSVEVSLFTLEALDAHRKAMLAEGHGQPRLARPLRLPPRSVAPQNRPLSPLVPAGPRPGGAQVPVPRPPPRDGELAPRRRGGREDGPGPPRALAGGDHDGRLRPRLGARAGHRCPVDAEIARPAEGGGGKGR